ncbi:beta-lactamase/transpeptidase-like protein [Clohesyomyces aquaticus]|uniref:Beta-lactamase/transpeptidase-like protein n=1 Tax=Clohesyomyces aquaticus TaxID=1231657 RepID=A0A1Y1Y7W8_9PLEO|nr:beta-lactamase/transpeptidase-like protein [Clohesyomyces aquaticus]
MPTEISRNPFNGPTNGHSSQFDTFVTEAMDYWQVPGLAIAVVDQMKISSRGYGVAQFEQDGMQDFVGNQSRQIVTPQTLFDCASMSKSFTAAAIALLVDDSAFPDIQWRTPVSKICEDFAYEDQAYTDQVSIEDILSHRSGMPGHDNSYIGIHASKPDTPRTVTQNLRNLPLSRPLRTEYQYCNMLYTSAAYLVEHLTQIGFGTYLSEKLWKPLGMEWTFSEVTSVPVNERVNLARPYQWVPTDPENFPGPSTGSYKGIPHEDMPEGIGAGSVFSSVDDMARWIRCLLHRTPPLPPSAHDELVKPRICENNDPLSPFLSPSFYAMGLGISYYHGYRIVRHDGLVNGSAGLMLFLPTQEWGLVMLANSTEGMHVQQEIAFHLIDQLLGIPQKQIFDWRQHSIHERAKYLKEMGVDFAYPELRDRKLDGNEVIPALENLAGTYGHPGYHTVEFKYGNWRLEADWSERSMKCMLYVKDHAYENWFVAELVDIITGDNCKLRCQFEVGEDGCGSRVGIALCEEIDELIWFDRLT